MISLVFAKHIFIHYDIIFKCNSNRMDYNYNTSNNKSRSYKSLFQELVVLPKEKNKETNSQLIKQTMKLEDKSIFSRNNSF